METAPEASELAVSEKHNSPVGSWEGLSIQQPNILAGNAITLQSMCAGCQWDALTTRFMNLSDGVPQSG